MRKEYLAERVERGNTALRSVVRTLGLQVRSGPAEVVTGRGDGFMVAAHAIQYCNVGGVLHPLPHEWEVPLILRGVVSVEEVHQPDEVGADCMALLHARPTRFAKNSIRLVNPGIRCGKHRIRCGKHSACPHQVPAERIVDDAGHRCVGGCFVGCGHVCSPLSGSDCLDVIVCTWVSTSAG